VVGTVLYFRLSIRLSPASTSEMTVERRNSAGGLPQKLQPRPAGRVKVAPCFHPAVDAENGVPFIA
jgi:hypothetical protein